MSCTLHKSPGGAAIVCTRGSRRQCMVPNCRGPGAFLCDAPRPSGRTCSAAFCGHHKVSRDGLDYCPPCARELHNEGPGDGPRVPAGYVQVSATVERLTERGALLRVHESVDGPPRRGEWVPRSGILHGERLEEGVVDVLFVRDWLVAEHRWNQREAST